MNWRIARTIFGKEMLDTMRDRRTLLMMVGVPLVLYPGLLIFSAQMAVHQKNKLDDAVSKVAVVSEEPELVKGWLAGVDKIELVESEDPAKDLRDRNVQAVLETKGPVAPALAERGTVAVTIRYDGAEFSSQVAEGRVSDALEEVLEREQASRIQSAQLPESFIHPLDIQRKDEAPPAKQTGTILGAILPLLMVISTAVGAFYPAVDLTAGEKERGTFETLLSTPAGKLEIVTGKFFAVFTLAMATGILNLGSMALTFMFLAGQLRGAAGSEMPLNLNLPMSAFAILLVLMLPLGLLVSAMAMSVSIFAKSFKEAQNYLTPALLLVLFPTMMAAFPGTELNSVNQLFPIFNVVVLFRELVTGKAELEAVLFVFGSMCLYAGLAVYFAAWLFQREEVVLSEQAGIPLTWKREMFRPRLALTPGTAMGLYALMILNMFYLGSLVQGWHLLGGLVITLWLLILAPTVLLLWYAKIDLRSALSLRPIGPLPLLAATVTGCGAILLNIQFGHWHQQILPMPKELAEQFSKLFASEGMGSNLILLLLIVAVSPSICEEVLFRGAILSGLRERLKPWAVIVLVGLLFGIFHISIYRILPTALLGMVLTYLVLRTGSIYPAMLVHFMNNALGVLAATETIPIQWVEAAGFSETGGVSWWALGMGVLLLVVGVSGLELRGRNKLHEGALA